MKISNKGIEFVKRWEGVVLKSYQDVAGKWTIGVGHLLTRKELATGSLSTGVNWRKGITDKQATELLHKDIQIAVVAVNKYVKVPLSQNQFDTLVSFAFNLGGGNLKSSDLLELLNAGKYSEVPKQLNRWRTAGGKVVKGLVNRRRAEGVMWRDADIKPAIKSRTNQGIAAVATGQVISYINEATVISQATNSISSQFGEYAQLAGIGLTVLGIAYVIYARWDDKRNGIR